MSDDDLRALLERRMAAGEFEDIIDPPPPKKKAAKKKRAPAAKVPLITPETEWPLTFPARVLAFDQTLSACAWAWMECGTGKLPEVLRHGTIVVGQGRHKGHGYYQTFEQGDMLYGAVRALILELAVTPGAINAIVHEMPAVKGFRAESSIMAARSVRDAVASLGRRHQLGMMQAQHVKKAITGDGNAPKTALAPKIADLYAYSLERTNADERDAIAIGLTAVYDGVVDKIVEGTYDGRN